MKINKSKTPLIIILVITMSFLLGTTLSFAANGMSGVVNYGWFNQDIYFDENQCRNLADSYGNSRNWFAAAGGVGGGAVATRVVKRDPLGYVKTLGTKGNLMTWAVTLGCAGSVYTLRQLEIQYRKGSYNRGCIARCFMGVPFAVDLQ